MVDIQSLAWLCGRHVRITLEPTNPDFEPIALTVDDEDSVAVVAELIEAWGPTRRSDAPAPSLLNSAARVRCTS